MHTGVPFSLFIFRSHKSAQNGFCTKRKQCEQVFGYQQKRINLKAECVNGTLLLGYTFFFWDHSKST